ncbi:hypothetical protein CR513_57201, partial [Mucuna pruriens]
MSNIPSILERVGPTLVYPTTHQLDRLVCDAEVEVQDTIFYQQPSPPHSRSLGQPSVYRSPTTMDGLRTRAISYIQMEEMVEFRDSICTGQSLVSHVAKEHGHFEHVG